MWNARTINWKLEHMVVEKPARLVRQTFDLINYAQMSVTHPICKTIIKTLRQLTLFALNPVKIRVKTWTVSIFLKFACQLRVTRCFGAVVHRMCAEAQCCFKSFALKSCQFGRKTWTESINYAKNFNWYKKIFASYLGWGVIVCLCCYPSNVTAMASLRHTEHTSEL